MIFTAHDTERNVQRQITIDELRELLGIVDPIMLDDAHIQARIERYNVGRWHYGDVPEAGVFVPSTKYYFDLNTEDIAGRLDRYDNAGRWSWYCDQEGIYNVKPFFKWAIADSPAQTVQMTSMQIGVEVVDPTGTIIKDIPVGYQHQQQLFVAFGSSTGYYPTWLQGGGLGSADEIEMQCDYHLRFYWIFTGVANITLFTNFYARLAINRVNDSELFMECCS